jgi:hypothetical protein
MANTSFPTFQMATTCNNPCFGNATSIYSLRCFQWSKKYSTWITFDALNFVPKIQDFPNESNCALES